MEIKAFGSRSESVIYLKTLKTSLTLGYRKINVLSAEKFEIDLSFKQLVSDYWYSYDLLYGMKFRDEKGTTQRHRAFKPHSKRWTFFFFYGITRYVGAEYKTRCDVTPEFQCPNY